jgi:hypothetical protein
VASRIRITVDGKLAMTTRQAAEEFGLELSSVRSAVTRLGLEPVDHLDERTPLYAAVELRKAMRARPGKGANLRRTSRGSSHPPPG